MRARARHEPVPEDGYQGDYVAELAAQIPGAAELRRRRRSARAASALIMEGIRETLHAYRVDFDTFFLEGSLHEGDPSPIAIAYERLREHGPHVRVRGRAVAAHDRRSATTRTACCERSTGAPTYFAADVAYQEDKFRRGFDRLIYVLGADHHGYIARLKAIAHARRGPGPGRGADPAVRARRRGRRAGEDVQAPR